MDQPKNKIHKPQGGNKPRKARGKAPSLDNSFASVDSGAKVTASTNSGGRSNGKTQGKKQRDHLSASSPIESSTSTVSTKSLKQKSNQEIGYSSPDRRKNKMSGSSSREHQHDVFGMPLSTNPKSNKPGKKASSQKINYPDASYLSPDRKSHKTHDQVPKGASKSGSADPTSNKELVYIGNRDEHLDKLPDNFTSLSIDTKRPNATGTPERQGFNNTRMAKTAPARLLYKLYETIRRREDLNSSLAKSGSPEVVKGNLACGQLSIIPHDPDAPELYLNIKSSDNKGKPRIIVTPSDLYGKSAHTFPHFGELCKDYLASDLADDPDIQAVLASSSRQSKLEDAATNVRLKTHHSEQFFIAAIYKTLLALKESGTEISNSTAILDISTHLAPCDHCVQRINDFFNYLRENVFPDNNYFVARISWLKEYNHGQSPSTISRIYDSRSTKLSQEYVEISDTQKNYMLGFKATNEIAINSNITATNSGKSAEKSTAISSSNSKVVSKDEYKTQLVVDTGGDSVYISPPRLGSSKKRTPRKQNILAQQLSDSTRRLYEGAEAFSPEAPSGYSVLGSAKSFASYSLLEDDMSPPMYLNRRDIPAELAEAAREGYGDYGLPTAITGNMSNQAVMHQVTTHVSQVSYSDVIRKKTSGNKTQSHEQLIEAVSYSHTSSSVSSGATKPGKKKAGGRPQSNKQSIEEVSYSHTSSSVSSGATKPGKKKAGGRPQSNKQSIEEVSYSHISSSVSSGATKPGKKKAGGKTQSHEQSIESVSYSHTSSSASAGGAKPGKKKSGGRPQSNEQSIEKVSYSHTSREASVGTGKSGKKKFRGKTQSNEQATTDISYSQTSWAALVSSSGPVKDKSANPLRQRPPVQEPSSNQAGIRTQKFDQTHPADSQNTRLDSSNRGDSSNRRNSHASYHQDKHKGGKNPSSHQK